MNFNSLKKQVEMIKMPQNMRREIISSCYEEIKRDERKKERFSFNCFVKSFAAALIAMVFIFIGISALIANVPEVYCAVYYISPRTAQFFMPVEMSCVKDGIKMNVESVYIKGSTAKIWVSLQDLTGNRVDETTDLNDSYGIYSAVDYSSHCQMNSYNETEKKATYLIEIESHNGENINKDKVTFMLGNFISEKEKFAGIVENIDLTTAELNPKNKTIEFIDNFDGERKTKTVLDQNLSISSPVNNIEITGIGYVDGKLHVQVCCKDHLKTGSYLWLYLDENGKARKAPSEIFSFDDLNNRIYEYVFEETDSINNYQLYGRFSTGNNYTEGPWTVTFNLEER